MTVRVESFPSISSVRAMARRGQALARAKAEKRRLYVEARARSITPGREQIVTLHWS